MKKFRSWPIAVWWSIGICLIWCYGALTQPTPAPQSPSNSAAAVLTIANYHINGDWSGRLILPTPAQIAESTLTDWVWIEIQHAPDRGIMGKTLPLTWNPQSPIATDIPKITIDLKFTAETLASQQKGTVHPQRLNGRSQVGALQSLAGARNADDVWVKLAGVVVENGVVRIDREPTQITGKFRGLVKILGTDAAITAPLPTNCPGAKPCASEYFRVQHYHPQTQKFDGQITTIRIPQAPARSFGLFPSTVRDLEKSPAGKEGWYVYGDFSPKNPTEFVVAAIQPRSLLTLKPQQEITGAEGRSNYIERQHWQNTPQRKGQIDTVGFNSDKMPALGTKALLIHLFGGIDGKTPDIPGVWQTVTGHFAYGTAAVVRDDFTQELQWDLSYNQVYAHNPDGIIAGQQDWATYMGSLQRGWSFTRPVSDLLISYAPMTEDYDFDGFKLSPLTELQQQLHLFAARYRSGDGTGNASVNPGKSCVQDANQALYITIQRLTARVRSQPQIQTWLVAHPQDPQTLRFRALEALGQELQNNLVPLGMVRSDWQQNAAKLVGINRSSTFEVSDHPLVGLASWRTMLPRGAQDGMGKIFSRLGAGLWFLNSYQIGGVNPDIFPIAPTILFGQIEILSKVILRAWSAMTTIPTVMDCLSVTGLLLAYGIVALGFGWKTGFLRWDNQFKGGFWREGLFLSKLFFLPALIEEMLFRMLPIPHPIETAGLADIYGWSILSLAVFILYHPFNAWTLYPAGKPTFMDWRFLTLAGLLGGVCAIAYLSTGSLWPAVLIHWVVVVVWIKLGGGKGRLAGDR
jgi:predicted Abi (CAAX) family protease